MKNNLVKLVIIFAVIFAVSQIGYCDTATIPAIDSSTANVAEPNELTLTMMKFGKVMLGVIIASVVIYILLLVWNYIVNRSHKKNEFKTSLKSPKTIDEAILFFINKNKV